MAKLKIEYVPIEKLKPFLGNPRKNDESVDAIVKSIEAFGYTNPVLVRRANNEIIAGHTRIKALQKIGAKEAPVIYLDLDEASAHTYAVFDNKSVELADWDMPKLADLFVDLDQLNVDMDLTGFSADEIDLIAPSTFEPQAEEETQLSENSLYMTFVVTPEQREEIEGILSQQIGNNATEQLLCVIRQYNTDVQHS